MCVSDLHKPGPDLMCPGVGMGTSEPARAGSDTRHFCQKKDKTYTTEIFFNGVPNMTAHEDATRQVGRSNRQTYVHSKGPGVSSRKTGDFFSEVPDFKFKNVVKKRY